MHVRKMLQINVWFSVAGGLTILLVLVLSVHEIKSAMKEAGIAGDIISATFERNTFRNDYLQRNNERAKQQWFAKHAQLGGLLDLAAREAWSADNEILVGQIIDDYRSMGTLFSTIVAGRDARQLPGSETLSEREDRLLTQLVILSYDTVLHAGKLQESSREYLFSIIKIAGWSLVFVFVVVTATVLSNSWSIQRLIAGRVGKLREGAAAVGAGDLGYRIGLEGKDEFVELAYAFDSMTAKLGQSYFDLEKEMDERRRGEEELRKSKDELEERVRERTEELSRALAELYFETAERLQAVDELREKELLLLQQSRLAAMGEMLVNISHQWRQPLNVLGILLQELTRRYQGGDFTGEFLEARVTRGKQIISHMSQTIDDFRNFLSPDKVKIQFNVKEAVETTLSMVRDSFTEMLVEVRITAADNIVIEGYRNEYAQAVMNILINARDVIRERKVANPQLVITISGEKGRSLVTIADNAGGIPSDVFDRIFDPYFTTKPPDKGTGIGLFMSKMIIERNMGGRLSVRNSEEGAEFLIEM